VSPMPIRNLSIAAIGDEDLVNSLRLAGISKCWMIKETHGAREDVRTALTELIADPEVGVVVLMEDYSEYVADLLAQVRRGRSTTPVVVEVPSKFGTKYPDVTRYYKAFIRESIGFDIEI
jgi:vacuolar-type H+-ATPase subunit F/Vma7